MNNIFNSGGAGRKRGALGLVLAASMIWTALPLDHSATAQPAGQTQANNPATPPMASPATANGPAAPAQTNQPSNYLLRAQTNLVLVDVRVTDKHGQPINGLTRENFRISEDGTPQTIISFSFENVERLATASSENGAPAVIDLSKLPPNANTAQVIQDHRLMVLFLTSRPCKWMT